MYVLYRVNNDYILISKEKYNLGISNPRDYAVFKESNGFRSSQDIINYIQEYLTTDPADVEVIE